MTNSTPNLITEEEFNRAVKDWSIQIRNKIRYNAPIGKDSLPDNKKLVFTKAFVKEYHGVSGKIQFSFERHGVFVHYGVGRGYVREGNQLKRGRRLDQNERSEAYRRGYKTKEVRKMKHADASGGPINRTAVDWFDVEIKAGIRRLADIAQDFYGDKVLEGMLKQMDKALIEKK
jgi:hypothetical protein